MVRMSKLELALAPTLTLMVLVNIRLGQNVPIGIITNLYFLNFSQKCFGSDFSVECDQWIDKELNLEIYFY